MKILATSTTTGRIDQRDPDTGAVLQSWTVGSITIKQMHVQGTRIHWADGTNGGWVDTGSAATMTASFVADNFGLFDDGTMVGASGNRILRFLTVGGVSSTVTNPAFPGLNGESVVVAGDVAFVGGGQSELVKIDRAGNVLASRSDSVFATVLGTDGSVVLQGRENNTLVFDSDLTLIDTWPYARPLDILPLATGGWVIFDSTADLLHRTDANGVSVASVAMSNPAGYTPYRVATDGQFVYAPTASNQGVTALTMDLQALWSVTDTGQPLDSTAVSPLSGPTTPEQIFTASYALASAAEPKPTALVSATAVQRSIDTDVFNLSLRPKLHQLEVIFDVGELDQLGTYNPATSRPRHYLVTADQPGLRQGKKLLLKSYQIRDADPSVPVTCTFWG